MKQTILKLLPAAIVTKLDNISDRKGLNALYKFDKDRHKKYAYGFNKSWSFNNLRSKITFHYHSIEKGLSNPYTRFGFGERAFTELFYAMDKFIELGYPTEDNRFQQSISVVKNYVNFHEENQVPTEWVSLKLKDYLPYFNEKYQDVGGFGIKVNKDLPDYEMLNFKDLALSRYSIRDFADQPVDDYKVNDAIQIATKTPSVCNRQAYRVYRIKNEEILKSAYLMQGGLTTQGENLQEMLLVTCNREFMSGPYERNQTYIDGGMFLMSLVYGLTYNNIASCTLNTNFSLKKEKSIRDLLNISLGEDLIAFVAIGNFKDENKFAKSPRDNYKDITIVID